MANAMNAKPRRSIRRLAHTAIVLLIEAVLIAKPPPIDITLAEFRAGAMLRPYYGISPGGLARRLSPPPV
jgi:hypothetical protein